jgi:hypothetical protein
LYNLSISFRKFSEKFYTRDRNFYSSYILNNPCINTDNGFPYSINTKFWESNSNTNLFKLSRIKFDDILENGKLLPYARFNHSTETNISFVTYIRLSGIIKRALAIYGMSTGKKNSLEVFFSGFKKGSKAVRKILSEAKSDCLSNTWEAFSAVCNITDQIPENFGKSIGLWNLNTLPNRLRDFIFKFYHNRLGTNTRVSHFTDTVRWCTFCTIVGKNLGPFEDETFVHLFLQCPTVQKIHNDIATTILDNMALEGQNWLGIGVDNNFLKLFLLTIQFLIWEHKLCHKLPTANYCLGETVYILNKTVSLNRNLSNCLNKLNCALSRLWPRLSEPRW